MKAEGFFFDLDGTLIPTSHAGGMWHQFLKALVTASVNSDFVKDLQYHAASSIRKKAYYKDADRFLLGLKNRKNPMPTALVTQINSHLIPHYLEAPRINAVAPFRQVFDYTVTGDMTRHDKTCAYSMAANVLNLKPCDCVAFEDTYAGAKAADDAGFNLVIVNNGVTFEKEKGALAKLLPICTIDCYSELL